MKEETGKFFDKAPDAILAAKVLLKEKALDFAAGRAYYAMFYTAQALLIEMGLTEIVEHTRYFRRLADVLDGFENTVELLLRLLVVALSNVDESDVVSPNDDSAAVSVCHVDCEGLPVLRQGAFEVLAVPVYLTDIAQRNRLSRKIAELAEELARRLEGVESGVFVPQGTVSHAHVVVNGAQCITHSNGAIQILRP